MNVTLRKENPTATTARAEMAVRLAEAWHALRIEGDLNRSRSLFEGAARSAEASGDAEALGEAAVGVGGLWLHEQRSPVAQALADGWRRAALDELDSTSTLAMRLRVRAAAEADYTSGSSDTVLAELEEVNRCGDRVAIAEALHLTLHCLLGPESTELRMRLAERLLGVAGATGNPFHALTGLMWRTTNLLLIGDPHADRALSLLRAELEKHPNLALAYVVSAIDAMLAIRAGTFERAEQLAGESADLGRRAGDLDVLGWYGAHLVTIRFFQGRGDELLPMLRELVASPELSEPNDAFLGALATSASMSGDRWAAATALSRLRRPSLAQLRHNSIWLITLFGTVQAAHMLGDTEVAAEAYELLAPYSELPTTGSLAITCMGSTHYTLGVAASTLGRWDAAVTHFKQAMVANEALGHRPAYVLSEAALAGSLAHIGSADDASCHLDRARSAAAALGMDAWCSTWQAVEPARDVRPVCTRQGARWVLTLTGHRVTLDDSLGVHYLARLLDHPGTEISALELVQQQPLEAGSTGHVEQDLLDEEAKRSYRERITALQEQIDDAERDDDPVAAEIARSELDWMLSELGRATGLAGRTRTFPTDAERARSSVQKAIRRALTRIGRADPEVATFLEGAIVTGSRCVYLPERR
jgi:tetratricopeptide (TPR) repeat protein